MKDIEFHINGKKYRLRPAGFVILILIAAILFLLPAAIVRNNRASSYYSTKSSGVPAAVKTADADKTSGEYEGPLLQETEDAGQDYIDSTLFIGDSNTARFLTIAGENGKTFTTKENTIGVVGMGVDSISSMPVLDLSTGRVTIPEAVKILQPRRIIITFGTNNLNGDSVDSSDFITRYQKQLKAVEDAYPYADLIVNSIPPVAQHTIYHNVSMKQIDAWNQGIEEMCGDNGWKYLNSAEVLKGDDGYAAQGVMETSDGLHLSKDGISVLFNYIRCHALITEDRRPKPLSEIPEVIGVPSGLFETNPLSGTQFEEDPTLIDGNGFTESSCREAYGIWDGSSCYWQSSSPEAESVPSPTPSAAEETASPSPQSEEAPASSAVPSDAESEAQTGESGESSENALPQDENVPQENVQVQ